MNFSFNCIEALDANPQTGIAVLEGSYQNNILPSYSLYVNEIIDKIGLASAKDRELKTVSTSAFKFFSSNHRIIIKANENQVLGFIKVGNKRLYLHDNKFNYVECNPLIVFDFYVYEDIRNKGIGLEIFNEMLKFEKKKVEEIAYENASKNLIGFLYKNFGLKDYINQNNGYIVYEEFFNNIDDNLAYDNSTNRAIRALSCRSDNRNNKNNINNNFNDDGNNNNNNNLRNSGQNIIFNNRFDENVINKNIYDSKSNPIGGYNAFKDYYLINNNSNYYDNIYSRRKINLINDYIQSRHLDQDAYLKEQFSKKENSIQNSNNRLNNIYNNISLTNTNSNNINNGNNNGNNIDYIFNKRNSYATVFDDKKIIENNYYNNRYNNNNNSNNNNINFDLITNGDYLNANKNHIINGRKSPDNLQHYSPFSRYGKVYTTILPTSSSAYGNYYNVDNLNKNEQSVNRLYY